MTPDAPRSRLLIIGASILQVPAIVRARELQYEVGVVDRDPSAPGAALADRFFEVSTTDVNGVIEAATAFAPDGIVTIGTDMPMRSLAAAAAELNLCGPSTEAAIAATDKSAMAAAFRAHGVPAAATISAASSREALELARDQPLPVVVKPADSSGSRGVTLVHDAIDLRPACEYAGRMSRSGRVLVQEYMLGPEVSIEGFCVGEAPTVVAVTDKLTTGGPHFVELGHSQPSTLPALVLEEVHDVVRLATKALGLTDCAFHAEIIVTGDGPKVVEVGARLGGDFITSHLVPLSTGVDMIEALIELSTGRHPNLSPAWSRGSAVRFLDRPGLAGRVEEVRAMAGVEMVRIVDGPCGREVTSSTDRLGHVIASGETADEAVAIAEEALARLLGVADRS